MKIKSIKGQKMLDSRGEWTNKAVVELEDGAVGVGEVPAGASVGEREAALVEVDRAISNINEIITPKIVGLDAKDQQKIDLFLKDLDGTENKSNLGANAILAVSLGVCEASAASQKIPLYQYIAKAFGFTASKFKIPTPLFNVINGGAHANNNLSIQEFMVSPATHKKFDQALELGVGIYHRLEALLSADGLSTEVGDEGGFAPRGLSTYKVCEYLVEAGKSAGYMPGSDFFIALDAAANSFGSKGRYKVKGNTSIRNSRDLLAFYEELINAFPIIFLEDPFNEDDSEAWADAVLRVGEKVDIVGDDLIVTNTALLKQNLGKKTLTGVIVKPNQIGTLSETVEFVKLAQKDELVVTVSHRSGETGEDTFIADLAVAIGAQYIKAGAPARGERVVKYNRLLEIYEELSSQARPPDLP